MKNSHANSLSVVALPKPVAAGERRPAPESGLTLLDRERRVLWCNEAARAHLGGGVPEPVQQAVAAGDFGAPVSIQTGERAVSVQALPFMESETLLVSRDVSASVKLDAMRRDFVADTSHELRAPLCVLGGLIETMTELDLDPGRSREYMELMAEQCKRMRNIVDGLLELSALEAMAEPGHDERVRMEALLARLRAEAEVLSGGRHSILLDAQAGYDLLGSERDISSALGNLVANAVRYTKAGGEIRLVWRVTARGAEFAVEDTGVGIEARHIPMLTERFYRVQKAARRGTGGTGLGLAIVKAALSRHQAVLEIASEEGKGSRFVARFPAHRVTAAAGTVSSLAA